MTFGHFYNTVWSILQFSGFLQITGSTWRYEFLQKLKHILSLWPTIIYFCLRLAGWTATMSQFISVFLRKLRVGFFSNPAIRALRYIYRRQFTANTWVSRLFKLTPHPSSFYWDTMCKNIASIAAVNGDLACIFQHCHLQEDKRLIGIGASTSFAAPSNSANVGISPLHNNYPHRAVKGLS